MRFADVVLPSAQKQSWKEHIGTSTAAEEAGQDVTAVGQKKGKKKPKFFWQFNILFPYKILSKTRYFHMDIGQDTSACPQKNPNKRKHPCLLLEEIIPFLFY